MAPDGVEREMLVVNGQYPGPAIVANWGDLVVIHVQNNMQNNGYICFQLL
jgi:FtsP/CotA-like multicopper oxidase with cupredoxin domain